MDTQLTNRQRQAIETKQRILECAIGLVKELGFEKVTISAICKKAGVSIGSFYYHFKSLDFIIIETYKRFDEELEILDKEGYFNLDTFDKVLAILEKQLEYTSKEDPELVTQFYKSQISIGNEYFLSLDRFLPKLILKTLKEGQSKGLFTNSIDAQEMTNDILTISRGSIYDWCLKQGGFNLVERGLRLVKIYLNSYITK